MNPKRLRLTNYRTFERLELDLPDGCVGVVGVNGAGKSSVIGAIEVAIFGPGGRGTLAPYLSEAGGDSVSVELELEHHGDVYVVRRAYSATGRGKSTLDFERWVDMPEHSGDDTGPEWRSLTQGNMSDTQTLIETTLGVTRDTFRASAFLAQGDGAAFTEADPSQRKRILANVLALEQWERRRALVAADARHADATVAELDATLERTRTTIDTLAGTPAEIETVTLEIASADVAVDELEKSIARRSDQIAELAAAASTFDLVTAAADAARRRQQDHEARARHVETTLAPRAAQIELELSTLAGGETLAELEEERERTLERKSAVAALVAAHDVARREHELARARQAELMRQGFELVTESARLLERAAELEAGDDDAETCDRCGQTMGAEARAASAASYRADSDELLVRNEALVAEHAAIVVPPAPEPVDGNLAEIDERVVALQAAISKARGEIERRAELEHELRTARLVIDEIESDDFRARAAELEREALAAEAKVTQDLGQAAGRLDDARAELERTRERADIARRAVQDARQRLGSLQERLGTLKRAESDIETLEADRARERSRLADLRLLEQAFGRAGVPAWIVEQRAIPHIEREACRLLEDLGGPVSRVELRTERALKGGGVSDDELDIVCVTAAGERDYATFSGGERTRVNLALRIALARLLASSRGAESRVLAIDEPEFLDEDGTSRLVAVLREQVNAGSFDRVLLVSHVPTLRDAFDTVLAVEKIDGASRVEVM